MKFKYPFSKVTDLFYYLTTLTDLIKWVIIGPLSFCQAQLRLTIWLEIKHFFFRGSEMEFWGPESSYGLQGQKEFWCNPFCWKGYKGHAGNGPLGVVRVCEESQWVLFLFRWVGDLLNAESKVRDPVAVYFGITFNDILAYI